MIAEIFVLFIAMAINAPKVELKDVDVLTFNRNELTKGRRLLPIQQLQVFFGVKQNRRIQWREKIVNS